MKILYLGDIMGEMGITTVEELLPDLIKTNSVDLVVAQAENVSDGKGLTLKDYERLKTAGVQVFTGGNWTMHLPETEELLEDVNAAVTRPANYPSGTIGKQYKIVDSEQGRVLVVSLLGSIVGKDADKEVDNPLKTIDNILNTLTNEEFIAKLVNFHGDYSSEKVVAGHYLDGRVTAVVGDHWHVPTADARVLPDGTAHITDVGMCGSLNSSLGVKYDSIIYRWRDGIQTKNELELDGPRQLNAVLVETNPQNFLSKSISQIRIVS